MVDLDQRTRVRDPGQPEEELERLTHGGDDRAADDPCLAARLAELDLDILGVGDADGEFDLLQPAEVQRLLRDRLDPDLDAVHPCHALAALRGDAVPHAAAASRRAVHHGEHRDDPLLQAIAAVREAHRPPAVSKTAVLCGNMRFVGVPSYRRSASATLTSPAWSAATGEKTCRRCGSIRRP